MIQKTQGPAQNIVANLRTLLPDLESVYKDIHSHPELSMQEKRTAGIAADSLRAAGYEAGVGKTGVVGVLRNSDGPPSPEELNFLREQFAIQPGKRVLDIPCGAGWHAVPLEELGYAVTGLDISAQFISETQRLGQDHGVSVDWRLGDMRTLAFEGEFDAALCFGNSFGYLSRTDTKHFLKRLSAALRDGATFVWRAVPSPSPFCQTSSEAAGCK